VYYLWRKDEAGKRRKVSTRSTSKPETFPKAIKAAELPPRLHFHSLRQTFASWPVQDGVSLYQVARPLGHSSTAVTGIDAHLLPQDMYGVLAPLHLEDRADHLTPRVGRVNKQKARATMSGPS